MTTGTISDRQTAVGQFHALVLADEALQEALSRTQDPDRFVELAGSSAAAHGISLDGETVRSAIRPDPLGVSRFMPAPLNGSRWPPRHWLPIQVVPLNGQLFVDWAYFGAAPLTDPFFEGSIRRALWLPFNRMFRYRMSLDDFLKDASHQQSLQPSGFIFHMSRCGSTLVSQMLAALPSNIVISEAAPIDAAVQFGRTWPGLPADQSRALLIAMVAAYGRRRAGNEKHAFIKLDSWHALALPLFAQSFPSVPWAFLYRDPVEVLVSQIRQRGTQMVPEIVPPSLYGIDDYGGVPDAEYCARVLAKICTAVADHYGEGGGLLVNYRELPDALWTRILPHFGASYGEGERATMTLAARNDAKAPRFAFTGDTQAKQREATTSTRELAERHDGEVYRRLENLRLQA